MMTVQDFKERIKELEEVLSSGKVEAAKQALLILVGVRLACFFMEDMANGELFQMVNNIINEHQEKNT